MAKKYSAKEYDPKIEGVLENLRKDKPEPMVGTVDLLSTHRDTIATLVGEGYSHQQIAEALKGIGVVVQPKTLSQVIGKGRPPSR